MKRIAISILIGITSSLIVYGFIQYRKTKLRSYYANLPSYNGELKIRIGDIADDKRSVVTTLGQIKKRLDVKTEQIDKNNFKLSVKDVFDTNSIKKLIVESIQLRFLETYSLGDLQNELNKLEKELTQRSKEVTDTSDKYAFLSEPDNNETKRKQGTILLTELISFYPSNVYQDGKTRYPAQLGLVKMSDTAYLNKILNEEKIKRMFPADLFFAYGKNDENLKTKDPGLYIYAIRTPDFKYNPCPTGDNIKECQQDFDPLSGNPILTMEFDTKGSDYWYTMTKRNIGKPIAIMANEIVLTAPSPESAIEAGKSRITGSFSVEEVRNLSAMVKSGKLELPATILESKFKSAKKGISALWMLCLVFLIMSLIAYGVSFAIKPTSKP